MYATNVISNKLPTSLIKMMVKLDRLLSNYVKNNLGMSKF